MAIYIKEENKKGGKWFGFIFIIIVLSIIGVASYYVFFIKPEIITNITPSKLKSINKFANTDFNPEDVINSKFFKNLKQVLPEKKIEPAGNSSPFGVF